jgi:pimeloyl-[acyl-carrier protein] methyl ester esterase
MNKQKHFILVRGLIREAAHWAHFPQLLKAHFPDAQISTLDIPGAGQYNQTPSPLSISKMVETMRADYLKNNSPQTESILVAISLGGMIAGEWMKTYPQDFQRVILINTSYADYSSLFERLKFSALLHLLKVPFLKGRSKEAHILKLVSNHAHVFDKTLNLWDEIQQQRPVSLANTFRQLLAAARFTMGPFTPPMPLTILASTQDRMVNITCSRTIAQRWSSPILEHPTAGHDLSADDPEWLAEKIQEIFKSS